MPDSEFGKHAENNLKVFLFEQVKYSFLMLNSSASGEVTTYIKCRDNMTTTERWMNI